MSLPPSRRCVHGCWVLVWSPRSDPAEDSSRKHPWSRRVTGVNVMAPGGGRQGEGDSQAGQCVVLRRPQSSAMALTGSRLNRRLPGRQAGSRHDSRPSLAPSQPRPDPQTTHPPGGLISLCDLLTRCCCKPSWQPEPVAPGTPAPVNRQIPYYSPGASVRAEPRPCTLWW